MRRILLLLFIVIPAAEIWLLISLGQWIGGWETFFLLVLTGVLGVYFAKREAQKVWNYVRYEMAERRIPGATIIDGICVFIGGLLLLTPGFLTDLAGFLLVLPLTRKFFRAAILALLQKWLASGKFIYYRRF